MGDRRLSGGRWDLLPTLFRNCDAQTPPRASDFGYVSTMHERTNDRSALPTSDSQYEGLAAGDDAMEDDLTEEDQITPARRDDVAHDLTLDP